MEMDNSLTVSDFPVGDTNADQNRMEKTLADHQLPVGDAMPYKIGSFLGKYQIKSFLGRGGMGVVYRGFDPLVQRDVALKVMPDALSRSNVGLQRFIAEARAVGKLIHPNATALYEIGQVDGSYFLAMEFVSGGSLACLLEQQSLPPYRATRYISEVCQGLEAAHQVGLIHRDIKPENLLRNQHDQVKITDFGLAKVSDALVGHSISMTNPGSLLGTPLYMSPEQYSGGQIDARTDIYSTGATYFHLLTGKAPYSEAKNLMQLMYAHCQRPVPDPRTVSPNVPEQCARIVMKAMSKNPDDRFSTASDMAVATISLLDKLKAALKSGAADSEAISTPTDLAPSMLKIWLLEPSRMQATVLKKNLGALGATNIRIFATIGETVAALASETPHAIISAMHLDDGSGDDLAAQLHAHPQGHTIFCFLVSSDGETTAAGSFYPGRPVVLLKPLSLQMLSDILGRLGRR